jgi:hypothetical protein
MLHSKWDEDVQQQHVSRNLQQQQQQQQCGQTATTHTQAGAAQKIGLVSAATSNSIVAHLLANNTHSPHMPDVHFNILVTALLRDTADVGLCSLDIQLWHTCVSGSNIATLSG